MRSLDLVNHLTAIVLGQVVPNQGFFLPSLQARPDCYAVAKVKADAVKTGAVLVLILVNFAKKIARKKRKKFIQNGLVG